MTTGIVLGWQRDDACASPIGFIKPKPQAAPHARVKSRLIADRGQGHALIVAPTGAGKSRGVAVPNLLHWDGSAVVLDIKGELTHTTAAFRRNVLGQKIVVLDPWKLTTPTPDTFNPIDMVAQAGPNLPDLAYQFAAMLGEDGSHIKDRFWQERAEALIAGVIACLCILKERKGDRCFGEVWRMLHANEAIYQLAVRVDESEILMGEFAARVLSGFLQTVEVTRSGILSTAESLIRVFASEPVREAVGSTSFDIDDLRRGAPLTIYIVIPPEKLASHGALLRLWLSAFMSVLTSRRVRPAKPTLLMLDEVAQLGHMPQLRSIVTLSRGYGVRAMLFVQSLEQLTRVYPDSGSLVENCSVIATFGHTARSMSETMAKTLGDMTADQLFTLPPDMIAVHLAGQAIRLLQRCDYLSDFVFASRASANPMFAKLKARAG
jgi:type IV secretion system protein VirD4